MLPRLLPVILLWAAAFVAAQAGTFVQFRTVFGTVEVELYDAEKPATTANFKRLVQTGAYQNTFFHRVVPGFVAQGGSYKALNRFSTNLFAPPWSELFFTPNFGSITNEFSVGPFLSNTNGTIAMAKLPNDPNSATSGWFFNLGNNNTNAGSSANLDAQNGGFTVFGRVIRDTNGLLGFFNARTYGNGLLNLGTWYPSNNTATNAFATLPVTYTGNAHPAYWNLLFVDISLLDVAISMTNGLPQISWTSVAGKTNTVEYTTTMPPNWQPLFSLVPNGERIAVIDNLSAGNPKRFYRVRVNY